MLRSSLVRVRQQQSPPQCWNNPGRIATCCGTGNFSCHTRTIALRYLQRSTIMTTVNTIHRPNVVWQHRLIPSSSSSSTTTIIHHRIKNHPTVQPQRLRTLTTNASNAPKPSEAGRIVLHQSNLKNLSPGQVKLCHGCGTEVRRQTTTSRSSSSNQNTTTTTQVSAHQILAGVDANKGVHRSKRQTKASRFADAMAMNKGAFLCDRCRALRSNNIFRAYDALADVSPQVFANQLQHIVGRRRYGMCLVVVDATDPEHSAVKHLRRIIGKKTPVWLVINKIDLLPKMDPYICQKLSRRIGSIMGLGSVIFNVFAVSSVTDAGILELAEKLLASLGGKDVFVVGCANVGKSTMVQRLAATISSGSYMKRKKDMSRREMCHDLAVTGSHLPGTTLQAVRIPCFQSHQHALWDTPGIINSKAVQYALFPVHIMEPMARPEAIPLPSKEAGTEGHWQCGYSLLIEAAWMDTDEFNAEELSSNSTVDPRIDQQPANTQSVGNGTDIPDQPKVVSADDNVQEEGAEHAELENALNAVDTENGKDDNSNSNNTDDKKVIDESVRVAQFDQRQAAREKKMAILAAVKERRRLKELGEKSDGNPKKKKTKGHKATHQEYRGPFVLGRIDLVQVENGQSVFAQAFLHPALRIRIVPTADAPDHATVPTHYLNLIRRRMEEAAGRNGAVATNLKDSYSIPLTPFIENNNNGEISPGDKELSESTGSFYMDIVFASLGWIALSRRGNFTVKPLVVEGSVFSKRPSLYPTNMAVRMASQPPSSSSDGLNDDPSSKDAMDRLRAAAKRGRHASGGGGSNSTTYGSHDLNDDSYNIHDDFHDDEWY